MRERGWKNANNMLLFLKIILFYFFKCVDLKEALKGSWEHPGVPGHMLRTWSRWGLVLPSSRHWFLYCHLLCDWATAGQQPVHVKPRTQQRLKNVWWKAPKNGWKKSFAVLFFLFFFSISFKGLCTVVVFKTCGEVWVSREVPSAGRTSVWSRAWGTVVGRPTEASQVTCIYVRPLDFSLPVSLAIFDFYVPRQNTGNVAYVASSSKAPLQDQAQPGSIK